VPVGPERGRRLRPGEPGPHDEDPGRARVGGPARGHGWFEWHGATVVTRGDVLDDAPGRTTRDGLVNPPEGPATVVEQPPDGPPAVAEPAPQRRSTAMWIVMVALLASLAVTFDVGARAGAMSVSALLVAAAVTRGLVPGPGPIGITVRSRGVDVLMFVGLAAVIAALAQTAPNI